MYFGVAEPMQHYKRNEMFISSNANRKMDWYKLRLILYF
jgi:hypothetical protein